MNVNVKAVNRIMNRYRFEFVMLLILALCMIISSIMSKPSVNAFWDCMIDLGEIIKGRGLDREIWHFRIENGLLSRVVFAGWIVAFVILELFRMLFKIDYHVFKNKIKHNEVLKKSVIVTPITMLITHMFVYTNAIYIHDVIGAGVGHGFSTYSNTSDKWASPFAEFLMMGMTIPWLSGVLAIIFMTGSVYLIALVLNETSWLDVLIISGLCATNSSIIIQHCFVGGVFYGELALFCCCLALYFSVRNNDIIDDGLLSVLFISLCTGIYGAYTPFYPSILIGLLIIDLFKDEKCLIEIVKTGIRYAVTFLMGMIFYYLCLRISFWYGKTIAQDYMGESELNSGINIVKMIALIPQAYIKYATYFCGLDNYLPLILRVIKLVLFISLIVVFMCIIINNRNNLLKENKWIWLIILVLIWPISINLITILAFGQVYKMMIFVYVVPFLFIPQMIRWLYYREEVGFKFNKNYCVFVTVITMLFIYGGIVLANSTYVHINNMYIQCLSIATRIIDRVEQCDGFTGEEDVAFLGYINNDDYFNYSVLNDRNVSFLDLDSVGSANYSNGFTYAGTEAGFLNSILSSKLNCYAVHDITAYAKEKNISEKELAEIENMTAYPRNGSVRKFGKTIFVNFESDSE